MQVKKFWDENAIKNNYSRIFYTRGKISGMKMWYKTIGENFTLMKKIQKSNENFILREKFLGWKCDIKQLEKILHLWKKFVSKMKILYSGGGGEFLKWNKAIIHFLEKISYLWKKILRLKCDIKHLEKIIY